MKALKLVLCVLACVLACGCAGPAMNARDAVNGGQQALQETRAELVAATQSAATQPGGEEVVKAGNSAIKKIDQAQQVLAPAGAVLNAQTAEDLVKAGANVALQTGVPPQYVLLGLIGLKLFDKVVESIANVKRSNNAHQSIQTAITTPGTTPPQEG